MSRNNYQYEKRQKDIAKKKKQDEKRQKRFNRTSETGMDDADTAGEDIENDEENTDFKNE